MQSVSVSLPLLMPQTGRGVLTRRDANQLCVHEGDAL